MVVTEGWLEGLKKVSTCEGEDHVFWTRLDASIVNFTRPIVNSWHYRFWVHRWRHSLVA